MPKQPLTPPGVEPDEPRCVCISVNESWAVLLLGAVHHMQYPEYWAGTLEQNRLARRQAKNLMAVISEAIQMGCCCNDQTTIPRRERYTSTGRMEVSYDGGTTWENGDNFDPRFNSPLWPPIHTNPGQDVKCIAATNMQNVFNDMIDQIAAEQELSVDRVVIIATAILGGLAIIFSGGLAAGIVAWFGGLVLSIGQIALQDMFTSTDWDKLKCIFYNNMLEDGSFDSAAWQAVKDDVTQQFEYSPRLILVGQLDLLGTVGLTNAGRKQTASPDVTCEDCENTNWCALWSVSSSLQYVRAPFAGFDGAGIPQMSYVWAGTTFYEWKLAMGAPDRVITRMVIEFETPVAGTDINGGLWDWSVTPGGLSTNMPLTLSGNRVTINAGTHYGFLSVALTCTSALGHIVSVKTEGEGDNPFGTDNC